MTRFSNGTTRTSMKSENNLSLQNAVNAQLFIAVDQVAQQTSDDVKGLKGEIVELKNTNAVFEARIVELEMQMRYLLSSPCSLANLKV